MIQVLYIYDNRTNRLIYAAKTLLELRHKINEAELLTAKEYHELRTHGYRGLWKNNKIDFEKFSIIKREYYDYD